MALPIFASDALSSVAYAPQELLMILLTGGLAFLAFAPWVAAGRRRAPRRRRRSAIASSSRPTPRAAATTRSPRKNLGEVPGVVVAAALLVDYVLTVAVSVASGVDNIISALPGAQPGRVELAVGFVILIVIVNLRGVREASLALRDPDVHLHRLRRRS